MLKYEQININIRNHILEFAPKIVVEDIEKSSIRGKTMIGSEFTNTIVLSKELYHNSEQYHSTNIEDIYALIFADTILHELGKFIINFICLFLK